MNIIIVFEKDKICGNHLGSGELEPFWGYWSLLSDFFIYHEDDSREVSLFAGAALSSCDQNAVISLVYKYLTCNEKAEWAQRNKNKKNPKHLNFLA